MAHRQNGISVDYLHLVYEFGKRAPCAKKEGEHNSARTHVLVCLLQSSSCYVSARPGPARPRARLPACGVSRCP